MNEEELIIDWIKTHPNLSAQKIYDSLLANEMLKDVKLSLSTLKRRLAKLKESNLVVSTGKGSGLVSFPKN